MSSTYKRYLWLANTLLNSNTPLSLEDIQNKWTISPYIADYGFRGLAPRTFHEHKEKISELFGIDIQCNGYNKYYIEDRNLSDMGKTTRWLLNSFNIYDIIKSCPDLKNRIQLEEIPEGTEYLSTIIKAIQENKQIEIRHHTFEYGEFKEYRLDPYFLKVYQQRWYVIGRCMQISSAGKKAIRQFALDRIVNIEQTEEHFTYPKDFSPEGYFKDVIGIWTAHRQAPQNIVIRAFGTQVKYLRSLPLHASQKELNTTTRYTDFSYQLCITPDLVRELLCRGNTIQVLEPEELKKELIKAAKAILDRYSEPE